MNQSIGFLQALLGCFGRAMSARLRLPLALLLFVLGSGAGHAQFTYTTNLDGIVITGYTGPGGDVSIPATIAGLPVVDIGAWAFSYSTNLSSITIPDTVNAIEQESFAFCLALGKVTMGNGVTYIGVDAFESCGNLTNIVFSQSLVTIDEYAFQSSGLTAVLLPASLYIVGSSSFAGCVNLQSVAFNNSPALIGDNAFDECNKLANLDLGNRLISIASRAFQSCGLFTNLVIPDSVINLEDYAFTHCSSLSSVTFGDGITNQPNNSLEGYAFEASPVTNLILGSGFTSPDWVFAFPMLGSISVNTNNPLFRSVDGVFFDKDTNLLIRFPPLGLVSYTVPDSVTQIGASAFTGCQVTDIFLPTSLTNIGDSAFGGCFYLTSIAIPKSVVGLGSLAFDGCDNLQAITVDALNPNFSSLDGVLFDSGKATLLAYPPGKGGDYVVPAGVQSIGSYAFFACRSLNRITIPGSVTSVGFGAFFECTGLTSATLGDGLRDLPALMFEACYSLQQVTLGNAVTNIGGSAFSLCNALRQINLPEGIMSIGGFAFKSCTNLLDLTIPASLVSLGNGAFSQCLNLQAVYFLGDRPTLPLLGNAFSGAAPTVFYLPGTVGWGVTFSGRPTAPWVLPNPMILNHGAGFGVGTNGFGFRISWATNVTVVVEASTNLGASSWLPLATNALSSGWTYFSDPAWTSYPSRMYRVRRQ